MIIIMIIINGRAKEKVNNQMEKGKDQKKTTDL